MKGMVFFLGKGGVGKTTLSSATAWTLAGQGHRVLIASLDPAHNLGDVFDTRLGNEPTRLAERLDGLEVDIAYWVARYLAQSRMEIKANYAYNMSLNLDGMLDILKYAPGTEEYAVLWAIEHLHRTHMAAYDVLVLDTPPTALTLRILAMPSLSMLWVRELAKMRERILQKRTTLLKVNPGATVLKGATESHDDRVSLKLSSIQKRLNHLHALFTRESYLTVVLNPDALSLAESVRIRDELNRLGITLRSVCLNKATPAAPLPRTLSERFRDFPIFPSHFRLEGVHGPEELGHVDVFGLVRHLQEA